MRRDHTMNLQSTTLIRSLFVNSFAGAERRRAALPHTFYYSPSAKPTAQSGDLPVSPYVRMAALELGLNPGDDVGQGEVSRLGRHLRPVSYTHLTLPPSDLV